MKRCMVLLILFYWCNPDFTVEDNSNKMNSKYFLFISYRTQFLIGHLGNEASRDDD